ncbi:glycosyltransferase family 31 protein [Hortaea werneckii]|nr:glycosyltransferase family 31 protein [Hortaea werneckii]KAI7109654.1 glycosyltransferase family 31 protein [Hortaea werneckii]KAI7243447.1 glycosyltransferase family 31 protein [Hortaea werneckii]KAI7330507.1 glycosyltransferase family 31 protein [Hortaea werneckii]KAI7404667.1 glycosyltransferase family 31 protein [Hortaea werneckii]
MISNKQSHSHVAFAIAFAVLYILWAIYSIECRTEPTESDNLDQTHKAASPEHLPCRELPGSDETLIVLRTGATELDDRLAVHLSTSLRCFPNYLIFSDLEENYRSEHIIDALADVSPIYQQNSADFELWRRLRADGRSALDPSELAGSPDRFANMGGKADNPGWKLDKWKFLPMVNRTLHERPDLNDRTDLIYAGSQMFISGVLFAHGGSGFIVSQPTMQRVVDHYSVHKTEIEEFTDGHWAGDCVLGKAFTDSGVPFTNAWPAIQGDYPGLVPYARADGRSVPDESLREWCYPTISYHHMSPGMTQQLWSFEQEWMMNHNATADMLKHKDVFTDFVMPQMMSPRNDWENLSDKAEGIFASVDECRTHCIAQPDCRQYSFDPDGMCRTRLDPRLGKVGHGFQSGWIEDRIVDFQRSMAPCGSESWPV